MTRKATLTAGLSLLIVGCATADVTQAMATGGVTLLSAGSGKIDVEQAQARRNLQLRAFPTDRSTAFASALHVLLDNGFRATHADAGTGFITAVGPGTDQLRLGLGGLSRHTDFTEASVFVEQVASRLVQVRITFTRSDASTGVGVETRAHMIRSAEQHQLFFAQLEKEIAQRQSNATHPEPARTASSAPCRQERRSASETVELAFCVVGQMCEHTTCF